MEPYIYKFCVSSVLVKPWLFLLLPPSFFQLPSDFHPLHPQKANPLANFLLPSVTSSHGESVAALPCSLITPFQINSSHFIPRILPQTIRKKSRSLPKTLHIVRSEERFSR